MKALLLKAVEALKLAHSCIVYSTEHQGGNPSFERCATVACAAIADLEAAIREKPGEAEPCSLRCYVRGGCDECANSAETSAVAPLKDEGEARRNVWAERQRQISAEGWTPQHDDQHDTGEMARAAACYALHAGSAFAWPQAEYQKSAPHEGNPELQDTLWPWDREWWKPKNPRRDLVRAAALILAEIERIDRAALSGKAQP